MADRDEKGQFIKGNTVSKNIKIPYKPRTTSGYFKQTVDSILAKIPESEVLTRLYNLEDDKFLYIYTELIKLQTTKDNNQLKNELERLKLEKENEEPDSNKTINVTFIDVEEDEKED